MMTSEHRVIPARRVAPAVFHGWQDGMGVMPSFRLYNLTAAIPSHPIHSTLSEHTLLELGYELPASAPLPVTVQ